jgi:hypothetical protein
MANSQLLQLLPVEELKLLQSAAALLYNVGVGLPEADQEWLANNLDTFIQFVASKDGGELLSYVIETCKEKALDQKV